MQRWSLGTVLLASIFFLPSFPRALRGEELKVTFGATSDLAAQFGSLDLSGNVTQSGEISAPRFRVSGFDFDGNGDADDRVELQIGVEAKGGELARLAQGYRLDSGFTLEFVIQRAVSVLGTGETIDLEARFVEVAGNNRASSFRSGNTVRKVEIVSTSKSNNRVRRLVVALEVPFDSSQRMPPRVKEKANVNRAGKRENTGRGRSSAKPQTSKERADIVPMTHAASPSAGIETESLLLARLFCDHMVLQQQTRNAIWGWAKPGTPIKIEASWGESASGTADDRGRWKAFLETPSAGIGHGLKIRAGEEVAEIRDVAIGEVWLCAGQSNMGWSVGNSFEAENELNVDLPDFRIFKSAREHWHHPLEMPRDRLSRWKRCDPETAAETSAVSYYFGKKLHQELNVPVGIIQQAFAGTPIEGWMPWGVQEEDPRTIAYRQGLDERSSKTGSAESALAQFAEELAEYNAKIDAGETMKNSVKALSPPIITKPANLGHQYPAHQFNAMIYPVRPYGIRGAVWYQGERNSKDVPQAANYRRQLADLITYYRDSWHELSDGGVDREFPFQLTQLPSWTGEQTEPVEGLQAPWAVNREMMRRASQDVPSVSMAVAIDTGDEIALHPKNKKPIGIRHAYLALERTYGKPVVGSGPQYQRNQIDGKHFVLTFDSVGSGLVPAQAKPLDAFAIAGKDRIWHWANAEIRGETILLSSPAVPEPVAARYAWGMNPSGRNLLYNREGIPASPFRTDDWPLFDPEADVVTVAKPEKPEGYLSHDWERPEMNQ